MQIAVLLASYWASAIRSEHAQDAFAHVHKYVLAANRRAFKAGVERRSQLGKARDGTYLFNPLSTIKQLAMLLITLHPEHAFSIAGSKVHVPGRTPLAPIRLGACTATALGICVSRAPPLRLLAVPDDADALKRAASNTDVDLGDTAENANAALEKLQSGFSKRLEALGASSALPAPPAPPVPRGEFKISDASAGREAAEAALKRMRKKDTGELEEENVEAIAQAQRAAKMWLDAGLNDRARSELQNVEKLCSYKTEVGAQYHLFLARVCEACGQTAQARRIRQRVMTDAIESTYRWQAEKALEQSSGLGGKASPSSLEGKSELGNLFRMPGQDLW